MSGGHFDYKQYEISHAADKIENLVLQSPKYPYYMYSDKTLEEFKKGADLLRKAYIYMNRIDWLVCGDDSEETFHERLKKELGK